MSTSRRILGRATPLVLVLALLAAACSGSSTTTISDTASQAVADDASAADTSTAQEPEPTAEPAPTQAPEPTAVPEPTAEPEPEPTATAEPQVATVFWGSELEPGMCINRLEGNPPFQPPDIISCDDFHEEEIYASAELDFPLGDPYPGEDAIADIVSAELCDEATIDFGGESWDLLPFDTFLLYPLEEEWDAGDRFIFCSAAPPEGVAFKIGTAAGGTLDTDDVVIARAGLTRSIGEFEDWVVLTEHATIDSMGSLSDGQFDIPLRRPSVTSEGLAFAAFEGGEGDANSVFAYEWANGEFVDVGSFSQSAELGGTVLADDNTFVIAAREEGGDWDLWISGANNFQPLAAGPGDQRFPTLSADQTEIIYQDNGDLWIIGIDGTNARQLTSSDANDWESAVSPDGSTVVFASDRSGNDDIWAVSIDGGEPVNLTNHPGDESWPFFSEDGSLIYFSSDRLDPVDERSKILVMNADGSNQSWFSIVNSSQGVLAPAGVADSLLATSPTLDERYNYTLIEGEPDTVGTWAHSSGRLSVELPVGWRAGEVNEQIGFLAAMRPREYFDTWATDGLLVLLFDGDTQDEFFARVDETDAVLSCEQFDGSDGVVEFAPGILGLSANHNCGEESVGGVIAFYNAETGVGVTIEGQTDSFPSSEEDAAMITAIAQSLIWE